MDTYQRLRHKIRRDRVFLLASAIAFNSLVTAVPILLLTAWAVGVFAAESGVARVQVLEFLERTTPLSRPGARHVLADLVAERAWIGTAGAIVLVWTATRLSTSLRQVLEIVFDVPEELQPEWLEGKLHDVRIVLLGGTLLAVTVASTSVLHWAGGRALSIPGMADGLPRAVATWLAVPLGLLVSIAMFYVVYRFVPRSRVAPLDAAIAAVFAGVLFELAKQAFVLWIPHSRQLDLYGSVAGLVAAALWIYYSSVVFVAGAEIASARRGVRESSSL